MTFYNHIESVRGIAIDLTNGRKWRGASDKAAVFDALDAARREYMRLSDENAELREVLREAYELARDYKEVGYMMGMAGLYELADRMRELGVEVDA